MSKPGELACRPPEHLPVTARIEEAGPSLAFFTAPAQDAALSSCDYSVEAEFQVLAEMARNDPNPAIRLAAIKMIRDHMREALALDGRIQQATARRITTLEGGQEISEEVTGLRLRGVGENTERLLVEAARIGEVIALETDHADDPESLETQSPDAESGGEGTAQAAAPRRAGEPERDLGGGGLCRSAQREAREAVEAWHDARTDDQVSGAGPGPADPPEGSEPDQAVPPCDGGCEPVPLANPSAGSAGPGPGLRGGAVP